MNENLWPDYVLLGATILTGSPGRAIIENGTISISGDRIVEISEATASAPPQSAKRVIHVAGCVIVPGFVNVHTHAALTMVRGVAEDQGFAPAYTLNVPQGHDLTEPEAVAMARLGALEALKFGSTLINDTYVHPHATLPAMADLGLRVWACGRIHDVDFAGLPLNEWKYDDAIGENTLAEATSLFQVYHGQRNGRIGVQLAAHAPDTCSRKLLERVRATRDQLGLRVTTHLCQSRVEVNRIAERDALTPPELLDDVGLLDQQLIAAHCIHVSESDVVRLGRARINVAHVPKGNATGGTIAPTTRLRKAGAQLALATDNMHADMIEVMRWALNAGRIQEGGVTDQWQPQTVFEMATMNGARAMGLDEEIGSIEVGKKADLVVVDFQQPHLCPVINPIGNLVHTGQGRDVKHVFVDGRMIVEDGRALFVDEAQVMREAQETAAALWERARRRV